MSFPDHIKYSRLSDVPERFDETQKLIEKEFGYSGDQNYHIDFAPLYNRENLKNLHILIDKKSNRVISHIGVLIKTLKSNHISTKVALIGGVSVDQEFQQQGLFKALFIQVLRLYFNKVSLFILWSEHSSLYQKLGFFPAIGQRETTIDKDRFTLIKKQYERKKFATIDKNLKKQIKNLYKDLQNKFLTFHRENSDWEHIEKITSAKLYIKSYADKVFSYFWMNKGQDLPQIIHEFGGTDFDQVIGQLKHGNLWLPERCKLSDHPTQLKYMALVKTGEPQLFKRFIAQWSDQKIQITHIANDGVIDFSFGDKTFNYSSQEFLTLLFGPNPAEELKNLGPPIYISGLDSI